MRSLRAASLLPLVLVAGVALVAGTMSWLMEHGSYDTWAAIPVAIGLVVVSVPMLRRAASLESDVRIARLLWVAFGLKLLVRISEVRGRVRRLRRQGRRAALQPGRRIPGPPVPRRLLHRQLGSAGAGNGLHRDPHRRGVHGHRRDQHRWVPRVLLDGVLGPVPVPPGLRAGVSPGQPLALRAARVPRAVVALLAVEHRQGSLDVPRSRRHRLRRRPHVDRGSWRFGSARPGLPGNGHGASSRGRHRGIRRLPRLRGPPSAQQARRSWRRSARSSWCWCSERG